MTKSAENFNVIHYYDATDERYFGTIEVPDFKFNSLLGALNKLKVPKRSAPEKPLRVALDAWYKIAGVGYCVCGKIL